MKTEILEIITQHKFDHISSEQAVSELLDLFAVSSRMDSIEEAARLTKLPTNKGKRILCIDLSPKDGLMIQTGRNQSHHSWWRSSDFCIRATSKQLVDE